jgi:hypothetical protein
MSDIRRPFGRFFCWLSLALILLTLNTRLFASAARTTRVTDTVYRADGSPARGTILISWPAFTAATGEPVAAGRATVTIADNGLVDLPLVANTGSTPSSFYTVVLKLDDGTTATEYWTVPSSATTTIAAIRSKVVPATVAAQFASRDYIDSALASRAVDTAVVHYAGDESITGIKTFTASPVVPTPTASSQAASKGYVDSTLQTSLGDARAGVISVKDFGARGDGGWYPLVSCTSGSAVISNVAALGGRLPKPGDTFVATGCGVSGADLQCTLSAASGVAYGTVTCGGGVSASTTATRGARWGASIDDTPAFTAAMNYCKTATPNGGCRVHVPSGVYFVSNVVFPAVTGANAGQVMLTGMGRQSSWIIGIGADQTAIFQAPANSVSTYVSDLGFSSFDYGTRKQIPVQWLGGVEHTFTNNFATNVYEMVNASNTWINLISNNRCYGATNCIEFGGSGTGPVNATRVVFNELAIFSGHAIWAHTNNASYGNTYAFNSIENDNPPFDTPVDIADNMSVFQGEYYELSQSTSGYGAIFRGSSMQISSPALGCMQLLGGGHTVRGKVGSTCSGQTYTIKNDSNYNIFYGAGSSNLSALNSAQIYGVGSGASLMAGGLASYQYVIGSAYDWPYGRVDVAGTPFGRSNSSLANPNSPTQFGANAVIPQGTVIANNYATYAPAVPREGNTWWICTANPCSANPINPAQWNRIGERYSKVKGETGTNPGGSSIPSQVGDFYWNTNGTTGLIGWYCTAAGTPGTWVPVYAIDPASPPALGTTTPNTIKATTVNATTGYQVNGTALVSSCGATTTCSNTAVASARIVTGSVTLTGGAATITGISPAFTSATSYICTCTDRASTPAACSVQNISGSSITLTGSATDTINYHCIGN